MPQTGVFSLRPVRERIEQQRTSNYIDCHVPRGPTSGVDRDVRYSAARGNWESGHSYPGVFDGSLHLLSSHTEAAAESVVLLAKGTQIVAITPTQEHWRISIRRQGQRYRASPLICTRTTASRFSTCLLAFLSFNRELVVHEDMPAKEVRTSLLKEYDISPDGAWLTRRLKKSAVASP